MSSTTDLRFNLRVNYGGTFYFSSSNVLRYRKGKVKEFKMVDPDLISLIDLKNTFKSDIPLEREVKDIWFLEPGKSIGKGLHRVTNDVDALKMTQCIGSRNWVHIYAVQEDEVNPNDLEQSHVKEAEVLKETEAAKVTEADKEAETANETDAAKETETDKEADAEILGSESSDNGSDFPPEESGVEAAEKSEQGFVEDDFGHEVIEDERFYEENELTSGDESDDEGRKKKRRYPQFNHLVDFANPICFKKGMIFPSNEIFRKALEQLSIEKGGDFYYLHNDKSKISAYCVNNCDCKLVHGRKTCKCKKKICKFRACARKMDIDGSFQLKSFVDEHVCGQQHKIKKVTSMWLAEKYLENYRDDPTWKLEAFRSAVKRDHEIDISYLQAWKARLRAMLKVNGDSVGQYEKVWDYAKTILAQSPGSACYVKVDMGNPEKPLFQRIYICFDAIKRGFVRGCRPIIGLDGCHLKGAYTGQVLAAVGLDGNNNIYPIAFAVVEAERGETWGWFLNALMSDIGGANPTFMSDRQKGLIDELHKHVSPARTRVCVRHMYNNFRARWSGKALKDAIWAAARAYTMSDFEKAMNIVRNFDDEAYKYLMKQDPCTWSRHAFDKVTKSDMLLNNICEVFNAYILRARDKPVLTMCEWIRRKLMQRFSVKRAGMHKITGTFTPFADKQIELAKRDGHKNCRAFWDGGSKFEVDHFGRTYIVDLETKTCGCCRWELSGIPCSHAMCCIMKERRDVSEFVSPYYTKEIYLGAYEGRIPIMPDESEYVESGFVPPGPPKFIVQPGRPKKHARKREADERPTKKRASGYGNALAAPKGNGNGNAPEGNSSGNAPKGSGSGNAPTFEML